MALLGTTISGAAVKGGRMFVSRPPSTGAHTCTCTLDKLSVRPGAGEKFSVPFMAEWAQRLVAVLDRSAWIELHASWDLGLAESSDCLFCMHGA